MANSAEENTKAVSEEKPSEEETTAPPQTEEVKEQEDPMQELQSRYDGLNDQYLRLAADFENYRKRSARDLKLQTCSAVNEFARDLLEIVDNFDRALKSENSESCEGLIQLRKQFDALFKKYNITPLDSVGEKFDPAKHEAIAYVPSDKEEGIIVDEACCGYSRDEQIIRFAKVVVSKGKGD